jgi:hypothetical protein
MKLILYVHDINLWAALTQYFVQFTIILVVSKGPMFALLLFYRTI